jgi:citrate synthase
MTTQQKPIAAGLEKPIAAGLEGIVAAETRLSQVDGEGGRLIICGSDAELLATTYSYENTAHLLWTTAAITTPDARTLQSQLGQLRVEMFDFYHPLLPELGRGNILEGLRAGWAMLTDGAGEDDHLRLVAATPVLIAALHRQQQGLEIIPANAAKDQTSDFLSMLLDGDAEPALVKALSTYLVTVSDHGMNASTFTARVVASTQAGVISAVVAALCALKGPLHGGAPGPVLDMLDDAKTSGDPRRWVDDKMAGGDRIMGFGHRIYRTRDPRADILKQVVMDLKGQNSRVAFAEELEQHVLDILRERHPGRRLDTNVEFYTALALEAIGLHRDLFTPAFALGRVLGWVAHIREQEQSGKIIRPASRYIGEVPDGATALAAAG